MKLLLYNHFFDQDIDALLQEKPEKIKIDVFHYGALRALAVKNFPKIVFSRISEYLKPQYKSNRKNYYDQTRKLFLKIYAQYDFDAIISPSDSFFYIRDWVNIAKEFRIPFIILQKETTISPYTMDVHSQEIKKYLPFISDVMMVCSEHHKNFWIKSDVNENQIKVLGQPRFDIYFKSSQWKNLEDLRISVSSEKKNILFFSYDPKFYFPHEKEESNKSWLQLRNDTEDILFKIAKKGKFNILIKPHPQQLQTEEYKEQLKKKSGSLWGESIQLIDGNIDTRHLIINSDVIVGFQSTALFEAMIAKKKVIYTFWTEPAIDLQKYLIPFHQMDECLSIAYSKEELELLLSSCDNYIVDERIFEVRKRFFQKYLGAVDGQSTKRVFKEIEQQILQKNNKKKEIPFSMKLEKSLTSHRLKIKSKLKILFKKFSNNIRSVKTWIQ